MENVCQVKIILHITIRHRCDPEFTVLWFKNHKWWSYHSFTERSFKMSKICIIKLETSDGFVKCIPAFTITIWDDNSAFNFNSKILNIKTYLWRSMQHWAYLWHLYSWLQFTLFSKGTVSSSIEIHFFTLSITTRSGLSLVTTRSGGIAKYGRWQCVPLLDSTISVKPFGQHIINVDWANRFLIYSLDTFIYNVYDLLLHLESNLYKRRSLSNAFSASSKARNNDLFWNFLILCMVNHVDSVNICSEHNRYCL